MKAHRSTHMKAHRSAHMRKHRGTHMSDDGNGEVHDEDDHDHDGDDDGDGDDVEVDVDVDMQDEEENNDIEEDDVEEENRSQDREAHFVRPCAIETHTDVSQEPFCVEIDRTNAKPIFPQTAFCASLRNRNAYGNFTKPILRGNLQEKRRTPIPRPAFRASLCTRTLVDISHEPCRTVI